MLQLLAEPSHSGVLNGVGAFCSLEACQAVLTQAGGLRSFGHIHCGAYNDFLITQCGIFPGGLSICAVQPSTPGTAHGKISLLP